MYMNQNNDLFARRLKGALAVTGVERGELARHMGVSVPTVNRWLNGTSSPNVYQFREIARYFGMSYDWFLDPDGGEPDVDELAVTLGLSPETVEALLDLADTESEDVLAAVDDAVCAVIGAVNAVYGGLTDIAEGMAEEDME